MTMRSSLKIVSTLAAMVICGGIALFVAVSFLMNLGLNRHDNYEYYGGHFGQAFVIGIAVIGCAAPAMLVWYLNKRSWRISLRAMFIAMFVVALILGVYSLSL